MSEQQHQNACEEYRKISRRKFIGGTAAVAASMSIPVWMPVLLSLNLVEKVQIAMSC
ncbi:MAG: twin-arginine translocation signal domain-containing protein [Fimbriimonadaceae bacterium]